MAGSVNCAGSAVEQWLVAVLSKYAVDEVPPTAGAMRCRVGRPVMGKRELVVVELATTGYNPRRHRVVEICATNLVTSRWWDVAVPVPLAEIEDADPVMLREIGYHERGLGPRAVRERERFAA